MVLDMTLNCLLSFLSFSSFNLILTVVAPSYPVCFISSSFLLLFILFPATFPFLLIILTLPLSSLFLGIWDKWGWGLTSPMEKLLFGIFPYDSPQPA